MKDNAHIVILARSIPFYNIGGMEIVAWELAKQFANDGVKVTLLTTSIPGRNEIFCEEGVQIVALNHTPPAKYSKEWWEKSRQYFEEHLMDSVSGVLSVSAGAYGILPLKSKMSNVPFILQAHGTSIGEIVSKWRTLEPKALLSSLKNIVSAFKDLPTYHLFDKVVAVGDAVKTDMSRPPISWFLPNDKIRLIPNGIDTNLFSYNQPARKETRNALGISDGEHVVLSVSRLHRQKGLDHSLRGFALFAKEDPLARYLVIGDGPEKENLKLLASSLGIDDRVCFIGAVSRENLPRYLAAGDILLFTTTHVEGLPLNVLEALAMGLPAVVSRHLKSVLQISHFVSGVNPLDPGAVAEGCKAAFAKSGSGHSHLPELYSLSECARQYYSAFGIDKG